MAHLTNTPYINNQNLINFLSVFAEELLKNYGGNLPVVDMLVVGGGAIALKHSFRDTVDIDADIRFSGNVSNSIISTASRCGIPVDWLNQDFMKSYSYSRRLWDNAILYTVLYNYMRIFVVSDIDQLCMKIVSGRKKDTLDIKLLVMSCIQSGIRLSDVMKEFYYLFGGTVQYKQSVFVIVKRIFSKYNML